MTNEQFDKAIEAFSNNLSQIHTGRVSTALVEDIQVNAYDSMMRMQEVASISTPEPQTLVIEPWDKGVVKAIESALRDSERDFNPVVDGDRIRISFPPLTEEKRKEVVKLMQGKAEEARVAVRKVREEMLRELKAQKDAGDMSEDDYFRQEKDVQETVDSYNAKIKEMAEKKESELMTV